MVKCPPQGSPWGMGLGHLPSAGSIATASHHPIVSPLGPATGSLLDSCPLSCPTRSLLHSATRLSSLKHTRSGPSLAPPPPNSLRLLPGTWKKWCSGVSRPCSHHPPLRPHSLCKAPLRNVSRFRPRPVAGAVYLLSAPLSGLCGCGLQIH